MGTNGFELDILNNSYYFVLTESWFNIRLFNMSTPAKTDAVWFTTKGQVVIPAWLRKQFHIQQGTKAIVEATPDGILLKPVTSVTIRRLRGILRRKPGDRPLGQEWAEHKREEKEFEETEYAPAAPVLDSYALLALLRDESGSEAVAQILERAGQRDEPVHMTEVNYAEVQYIVRRKNGNSAWTAIANELRAAPLNSIPQTGGWPMALQTSKPVLESAWLMLSLQHWRENERANSLPATRNSNHWKRKSKFTG